MFQKTAEAKYTDIIPLIKEHLEILEGNIEKYFPNISANQYDWVRNPFIHDPSSKTQLSILEEEELINIRNDPTLKLEYLDMLLESFWIKIEKEHPHIPKTQKILLQCSTSYLCELVFSTLTNFKTNKKRSRLLSVEEEMRVCLSSVPHNIERICKSRQVQKSH
ncbi:protein FAM200A-like [Macrobrachium rosenbergii]|uniref:protein FAM200A-like n=1 Tax=Macrobrachium rosenbergii TaxID=79674 RepID=UPI0034D673D1